MKKTIIYLISMIAFVAYGQISFEGSPESIDQLNSANGQNYLSISASDYKMAFTEEKGGSSISTNLYELQSVKIKEDTWNVMTLSDFLGDKGMISPVGFIGGDLLLNRVTYNMGIYQGEVIRTSDGKSFESIDIPFFKNKAPIQSGCISNDGRYMILSLETNNTYGVEDLYLSKKEANGKWSSLKNLGYMINTDFQEITPFLAADNKTLFFATNGRGGEGSFDVFYCTRLDDSWRNWSKPTNLGKAVNTSGSETSFAFQEGTSVAYFIRSQDSDGYGEIMRIKIHEDIDVDTTQIESYPVLVEKDSVIVEQKEETKYILLKVVDIETGEAVPAEFVTENYSINNLNGLFSIDSLTGKEVEIKAAGYLPKMVMLDERLQLGENIISLNSIAKGHVITLDHVLFERGTANMIEGSEKELNLVVEVMNDNPTLKILLKGHTDNTGDPVKNVQLSEARVKAVKEYILSQGINAFRVSGIGYGGNQPIASNEQEETRKLNRRVEFEVVED